MDRHFLPDKCSATGQGARPCVSLALEQTKKPYFVHAVFDVVPDCCFKQARVLCMFQVTEAETCMMQLWPETLTVERLLQEGVSPDRYRSQNDYRDTALHAASLMGHLSVVQSLLRHGADVSIKTGITERTALRCACVDGHVQVL